MPLDREGWKVLGWPHSPRLFFRRRGAPTQVIGCRAQAPAKGLMTPREAPTLGTRKWVQGSPWTHAQPCRYSTGGMVHSMPSFFSSSM